ncbi:MAG TPA: alcohol dehydrogenase catalytic domain-containing protein [Dehalococcoidia bacterium]|nr:alcohol dehydrogenase catalytic domain-containing protein [Dehalococcoidia bacterium]
MKALRFRYSLPRLAATRVAGAVTPRGYFGPWAALRLEDVPEPELPGDDWALVRTRLAGICGSDAKQAFLRGDRDNPLTALISFPQVLGHEAVGTVERVGPRVRAVEPGQRIALNPWLSCGPRGLSPCPACTAGDHQLCANFTRGRLPPGIHTGNCSAVGGAFAPMFVAHESQCIPVPEGVSDEQAVLADPFSVQLHAVLRHPPPPGRPALVYGCGTLGLLTIAMLRALHPGTPVWAVARHAHQASAARNWGADVLPAAGEALVREIAGRASASVLRAWKGLPWLMDGAGVVYDTVGSPRSIEIALRVAAVRAHVVITGVEAPRRFEWTPHYFKELVLAGSNAFAVEAFEGRRRHAMEIYFDLAGRGLDVSPLLTHRFALAGWREALLAMRDKRGSGAIKVAFGFQ